MTHKYFPACTLTASESVLRSYLDRFLPLFLHRPGTLHTPPSPPLKTDASSLSLPPQGDGSLPGVYEPVHGSAPDIAGKDLANPMAQVLSAAMMCTYSLELPGVAKRLEDAVVAALDAGYRTGDTFSEGKGLKKVGCTEMGNVLLEMINKH